MICNMPAEEIVVVVAILSFIAGLLVSYIVAWENRNA